MISSWLSDNPLAVLALLLGVSVVVPPLSRRLGMTDLVGLLVAGVLIGPHGLQWLNPSQPTVQLLSDGGVIYLLLLAGLEIDLAEFARIRQRSLRFGLLTFALPMLGGQLGDGLQAWLGGAVENDLIAASSHHDLVILRCQRRVVAGLPIPASERVSRLLGRL